MSTRSFISTLVSCLTLPAVLACGADAADGDTTTAPGFRRTSAVASREDAAADRTDRTDATDPADGTDDGSTDASSTGAAPTPGATCRVDGDCVALSQSCVPPGGFTGCPDACRDESQYLRCETDADCQVTDPPFPVICEATTRADCLCNAPPRICKRGCVSDSECAVGESCRADGRCGPQLCNDPSVDRACPHLFDCFSGGILVDMCRRRTCTEDRDCGDDLAFCVEGACYEAPGMCLSVGR